MSLYLDGYVLSVPKKNQRDRVNAAVLEEPRLRCDEKTMPFDGKRMSYGGFTSLVHLTAARR
jgi:uncharacterized protein YbaA (DUF1428 family)